MPIEDNVLDQGEALDFDPEFDHLFYSSNLDNFYQWIRIALNLFPDRQPRNVEQSLYKQV